MKTKNILFLIYFTLFFSIIAKNTCAQYSLGTITFENVFSNLYIDTIQPNNIWQIGRPQKILLDSSDTKPNAIITDTINAYPINNTSSFIVKILQEGWAWSPNWPGPFAYIEFVHKYNTDTIIDGGHLEYSIDAGIIWLPVQIYENNWGLLQWAQPILIFPELLINGGTKHMLDSVEVKIAIQELGIQY